MVCASREGEVHGGVSGNGEGLCCREHRRSGATPRVQCCEAVLSVAEVPGDALGVGDDDCGSQVGRWEHSSLTELVSDRRKEIMTCR